MPAATCLSDVFVAQPWLEDAISDSGPLEKFYDFAGDMEPCDQPLRIKSGKILFRKLMAVKHAIDVMAEGSVIIWLDTDVTVLRDVSDHPGFRKFVTSHDISYIPFTTNKGWGDEVTPNFQDIHSPYWRIESGIMAVRASARTRKLFAEVESMYRGQLLDLTKKCIAKQPLDICSKLWFMRNTYMDDIFAFSLVLHKNKYTDLKQGWFSMGCGKQCSDFAECDRRRLPIEGERYFFSHVCVNQTEYTAPFNLEELFLHHIGTGAYSSTFRSQKRREKKKIDSELVFTTTQKFNNTVEMRYPKADMTLLEDWLWDLRTLRLRQRSGMWPRDEPLTQGPTPKHSGSSR